MRLEDIYKKMDRLEEVIGSNMRGYEIEEGVYVIEYYWVVIGLNIRGRWYRNKDYYSISTSRRTSGLFRNKKDYIKLNTEDINKLITKEKSDE